MQVLKPEIRERILSVAERLFYEGGFSGTSTRSIADEVGISVSNLYKYFPDKQAIFAAVAEPFYQQTCGKLTELFNESHGEMDPDIIAIATRHLISLIMMDRQRFVILMGRADGTAYAGFKDEIIGMLARHMAESVNPKAVKDGFILRVFAENFFEGILKIAQNPTEQATLVNENVSALVRYHMAGIAQFY